MEYTSNPARQPFTPPPAPQVTPQTPLQQLGKQAVQAQQVPDAAQEPSPHQKAKRERHQARKELQQAIGDSNEILATAKTVFPFTFFPDTITIDRGKLTITHQLFFKMAEVTSIRVEDILNTIANVGPFFGSLKIATRFFGTDKVYDVNYLHREDALRIKRILQGYIIALQKDIDCTSLSTKELSHLLNQLGSDAG